MFNLICSCIFVTLVLLTTYYSHYWLLCYYWRWEVSCLGIAKYFFDYCGVKKSMGHLIYNIFWRYKMKFWKKYHMTLYPKIKNYKVNDDFLNTWYYKKYSLELKCVFFLGLSCILENVILWIVISFVKKIDIEIMKDIVLCFQCVTFCFCIENLDRSMFKKTNTKMQLIISGPTEINILVYFQADPTNSFNVLKPKSGFCYY